MTMRETAARHKFGELVRENVGPVFLPGDEFVYSRRGSGNRGPLLLTRTVRLARDPVTGAAVRGGLGQRETYVWELLLPGGGWERLGEGTGPTDVEKLILGRVPGWGRSHRVWSSFVLWRWEGQSRRSLGTLDQVRQRWYDDKRQRLAQNAAAAVAPPPPPPPPTPPPPPPAAVAPPVAPVNPNIDPRLLNSDLNLEDIDPDHENIHSNLEDFDQTHQNLDPNRQYYDPGLDAVVRYFQDFNPNV